MSGAITAAVITVGGGLVMANQAKQAAKGASAAQQQAAQQGIDVQQQAMLQQQAQWEAIQKLMAPFISAGTGALGAQQNLLGLSGPEAQQKAIDAIQNGPQFGAMVKQGENAMLQNASATGGLRGGNIQGALAQFRPQVLSSLINQQIGQLGGMAQLGQAGAAGQAASGQGFAQLLGQMSQGQAGLFGQMGQAQAGGILGQTRANMGGLSSIFQGLGAGASAFGNWWNSAPQNTGPIATGPNNAANGMWFGGL